MLKDEFMVNENKWGEKKERNSVMVSLKCQQRKRKQIHLLNWKFSFKLHVSLGDRAKNTFKKKKKKKKKKKSVFV